MISSRCLQILASQAVRSRETGLERTPGWCLRVIRTPFKGLLSLTLVTMLVAAIDLSRMFLRRLQKGRVFALAVSFMATTSARFLNSLTSSRSWIYSWKRRQLRPIRRENMWAGLSLLVPSFRYSKMKPVHVEDETSQMDYPGEHNPTQSDRPPVSHEDVKTIGSTRKRTERLIGQAHHVGRATFPSSLLRIRSVRRLDSLWPSNSHWASGSYFIPSQRTFHLGA